MFSLTTAKQTMFLLKKESEIKKKKKNRAVGCVQTTNLLNKRRTR